MVAVMGLWFEGRSRSQGGKEGGAGGLGGIKGRQRWKD